MRPEEACCDARDTARLTLQSHFVCNTPTTQHSAICILVGSSQCTLKSVRNMRIWPGMTPLWVCLKWSHDTWPVKYGRLAYQANTFLSTPSHFSSSSCTDLPASLPSPMLSGPQPQSSHMWMQNRVMCNITIAVMLGLSCMLLAFC